MFWLTDIKIQTIIWLTWCFTSLSINPDLGPMSLNKGPFLKFRKRQYHLRCKYFFYECFSNVFCWVMWFLNGVLSSNFKSIYFWLFYLEEDISWKIDCLKFSRKLSNILKKYFIWNICKQVFLVKVYKIIKLYEVVRLCYNHW